PDTGWFSYAPLSERAFAPGTGVDYYILGLAVNGAGTIIGAINLAVTILLMRCPGMAISRVPLFVWMTLVTSVLILGAYPALTAGRVRMTTAMLFAVGFIAMFVIGGLSGVSLAVVPIDLAVTDSYYVVAHLHYVLFGGTMLGIFAGAYYWFPKMTGRLLSEGLGRWHFWLTFAGFNLTFLPQH